MNYFELFSLPTGFSIDFSQLRKQYYAEAKKNQQDGEKMTLINKAYETLKEPFSRLEHLLILQGLETTHQTLPQSFLMEMMEWNEQLEEATTAESIENLAQAMEQEENKIIQELMNMDFGGAVDWKAVQEKYFFLKYILRNKEKLRNIAL